MSLEVAITENTAAIRELIAAIAKGAPLPVTGEPQSAKPATSEKPKGKEVDGKKSDAPTASSQPGATQPSEDQKADAQEQAGEQLAYDDIKVPFLDLIKTKGRDVATKLLGEFSAAKLPDVKPEQYADVLAAIQKAAA